MFAILRDSKSNNQRQKYMKKEKLKKNPIQANTPTKMYPTQRRRRRKKLGNRLFAKIF